MNRRVVINFDDFCDDSNKLDLFFEWKKLQPNLKITLFVIPTKISSSLLHKVHAMDWMEMVMHGLDHSPKEFGGLNKENAIKKIKEAEKITENLLVRGFKAPQWEISQGTFEALRELDYWVATHAWATTEKAYPSGLRSYRWNVTASMDFPLEGDLFIHGHVQDVQSSVKEFRNGIQQNFDKLSKLKGDFKFISEVVSYAL